MHTDQAVHIVLSENVPPTWGGVARVAFNVCVVLAEAGLPTVLCGFDRYVADPLYRGQKFSVLPIPSRGWKMAKDLTMALLLWRISRRYRGRPIVLYALTWKLARIARFFCARRGWRLVVFAHGLEVTKQLTGNANPSMARVFQAADLCLGVSRYTAEVLTAIGVPEHKVRVLNNSVDTAEFYPCTDPAESDAVRSLRARIIDDGVIILTLARVIQRKGQDSVIQALSRLRQRLPADAPHVRYVVAGRGPEAELMRLKALAQQLGVSDQVIFWGYVPAEQMRAFYNACDIYVMNSRIIDRNQDVEGFGITFLEASACGKPVIGGRSGGIPDAVADGVSGYLVDPEDIDTLTEQLYQLITDPELRRTLGANGLRRVQLEFTVPAIGAQLLALIENLPDKSS